MMFYDAVGSMNKLVAQQPNDGLHGVRCQLLRVPVLEWEGHRGAVNLFADGLC